MASEDWTETEHSTIAGTDHMFVGQTDLLAKQCVDWLRRVAR
jgi:alpha/beta superfamily hydrolase